MIFTVTITDHTAAGRSIADLVQNGSGTGYTVAPTKKFPLLMASKVSYLSIQASAANGASTVIYKGDENTANDGSCQGKELAPGVIDVIQGIEIAVHLGEVYCRASADSLKFNVEIHWA